MSLQKINQIQREAVMERMREEKIQHIGNNKIAKVYPYLSIIILHVSGLNSSTKRLALLKRHNKVKNKGFKKILYANSNQTRVGVAMQYHIKIHFQSKTI